VFDKPFKDLKDKSNNLSFLINENFPQKRKLLTFAKIINNT